MDSVIQLINAYNMDTNYNHTPWFTSKQQQSYYFTQRTVKTIDNSNYHRKDGNYRVDMTLYELNNVNYMIVRNENNETYFYFIIDKIYINEGMTELILQLDVIQTYMFDIAFGDCLIEREHIERWDENGYAKKLFLDENLETGEYILKDKSTIYDYSNKGTYFISSSDRLGVSNEGIIGDDTTTGTTPSNGENYKKGYLSETGFYLIKSEEGFSATPYNLGDGTRTTGYGVTENAQPTAFNSLLPTCTEEQASKILGQITFDNYTKPLYNAIISDGLSIDKITQNEFDAFGSLTYNSGLGNVQKSDIYKMWISGGDKNAIAERWKTTLITDIFGTEYQGLKDRRIREGKLFLGQEANFKKISNVTDGGYVTDNEGKGYIPIEYRS